MSPNYSDIVLWAIFLFLSYIGYGAAVIRLLNLGEFNDFGWAAKAAVGMSASIVLCSALMVFKAATPVGLTSVAVVGFGLASYFFYLELNKTQISTSNKRKGKGKPPVAKKANYAWLFLVIPGAFALLTFATSVYWPFQYDPNDDWIAYLAFPEKILQTGTLLEPFSQRRITSLCGQSVLLAQIMIFAEPESAHLLDRGFGAILLFGLLVEATRKTAARWQSLRGLFVLAAVTVSVPRINTSSTVIGVCLMFGVLFSFSKVLDKKDPSWKVWILPALILAGASSLRLNYAVACGGALAAYFFSRAMNSLPKEWGQQALPLFKIALLTFLFLSPLMLVSWESSRTPIYPPIPGNLETQFLTFNTGRGFLADSWITIKWLAMPELIVMLLSFPLVFFIHKSLRSMMNCIFLIYFFVSFLVGLNSSASAATWNLDFYRFAFPMLFTSFLFLMANCISSCSTSGFFEAAGLSAVALAAFSFTQILPAIEELKVKFAVLPSQEKGFHFHSSALKPYYDELQSKVPAGEKIFAIVDAPYLLNCKRNPISNIDNIAGASPSPGMPFHKGPEALKKYLIKLGYNYILVVDFDEAVFLYNRKVMENHPRSEFREFSKKYIVDFFDNIDAIASNKTISANRKCRLIGLNATN
jgi:hypothetical protein